MDYTRVTQHFSCLIIGTILISSCTLRGQSPSTVMPAAVTPTLSATEQGTSADVLWLKANAIPFETTEPNSSFEDLMPLKGVIGNARIVALGEATHGTHEFFQMKHRMLEFLVEEMGFNTFAMEAPWPQSIPINDYVQTGKGDPAELLRGFPAELVDEVRWMRAYNEDPSHTRKISSYGFDIWDAGPMARNKVAQYVEKVDPQAAQQVAENHSSCYLGNEVACQTNLQAVYDWLSQHQADYTAKSSAEEFGLALHGARVAIQYQDFFSNNKNGLIREPYNAENVSWILDQAGPDAKMVLSAHNGHVGMSGGDTPQVMGDYLQKQYGNQMVIFGFVFYQGSFRACETRPIFRVGAPPTNSYESFLHEAGLPLFFLDLRSVKLGGAAADWMLVPHPFRQIGSCYQPNLWQSGFLTAALARVFDVVVYFEDTSPSLR